VKLETLRAALIEGEQSGFIEDFDFDAFIEEKLQGEGAETAGPHSPPHE
jgi:antitoxin ParD1/3/4